MRILITSVYRPGNETGTARVSEELSLALSKKNSVTYLCLGTKYQLYKVNNYLSYLTIPSLPIKQGYVPRLTPNVVSRLFKDLDKIAPDVVHAQNIAFNTLLCLVWAIKNSVTVVVTFHSLPSEGMSYVFPKLSGNKRLSQINYKVSRGYVIKLLENVDLVIALNKYVKKSIQKITPKSKIVVINNGLELKPFKELNIKRPQNIKIFTFVGSYIERKNQVFLIKTFSYLPNSYRLKLYGNIETGNKYVKVLKKIIADKKITNVEINGFIDRKKILAALAETDYFISASLKEAQSLVIIEALASATPVIGLRNETIAELIDGKNGVSFPKKTTTHDFAERILTYVSSNENHYNKTCLYARKNIDRFDIDNVSEKILSAYGVAKSVKPKKESKTIEVLTKHLPKPLREPLREYYVKINKGRMGRIWFYIAISMLITNLSYPILSLNNFLKAKTDHIK
jgi:glycosyltransferase involved in cell wall biosynthesis